jgi:hypothetical protein
MFAEPSNFAAHWAGVVAVVTVICRTVERVYEIRSSQARDMTEQLERNRQTTASIAESLKREP